MRVLLADDQVWLRSAIRLILEEETGVKEIDEAVDIRTLLHKAQTNQPRLILLDWELPGLKSPRAGRELIGVLRTATPNAAIVVLSGRPEAATRALEAGADDFVSKADPPDRLLAIVRRVAASPAKDPPPAHDQTPAP